MAGSVKCQCCPHIKTSQLVCYANQLTGFYMRTTLAFNGLKSNNYGDTFKRLSISQSKVQNYKVQKCTAEESLKPAFAGSRNLLKSSRSSRPGVFCKTDVYRNFANFIGKRL